MYFLYILNSPSRKKYYIGYTSNPDDRLVKHNSKHKGFTHGVKDWEIVYTEQFQTKQEAMKREKQIKSWKNRQLIEALIRDSSAG